MARLLKRHHARKRFSCASLCIALCAGLLVLWLGVLFLFYGVLMETAHIDSSLTAQTSPQSKASFRAIKPSKTPVGHTFGHAIWADQEPSFLFALPKGVASAHQYRYQSNGIFWDNPQDPLYQKYQQIVLQPPELKDFQLATDVQAYQHKLKQELKQIGMQVGNLIVPTPMRQYQKQIADRLRSAGLNTLATIFENSYAFTLEQTTFPLSDGTTYVITGDIELMWLRDSSAQVNPYIPLLPQSDYLLHLIEGLLRRQSLFLQADPYATSFRLFLDFDFVGKHELTDWDYQSGRTIHVAMHNFELDNLAYHLRLAYKMFQFYQQYDRPMLALDDHWVRGVDWILETVIREQNHTDSAYRYPELPKGGKGSPVCNGNGLIWVGFRPSDDPTQFGYLIPANQMMVVSLRQTAEILRVLQQDDRAQQCEDLAQSIDTGVHTHGVVDHREFGQIYAYEVDACGKTNLMDDANVPSLLSLPYLEYSSPQHDPENLIQQNTRKFILSEKNRFFYSAQGPDGCISEGIGSPHTRKSYIWHMAVILRALTAETDAELRQAVDTLARTATHDLMHESFNPKNPSSFSRKSFAWANSLFAELITTKLDDILRVYRDDSLKSC